MLDYSNPFLQSLGNVRAQPQQNQFMQPQNQYDFSGWGDRLGKIEQGIAGLTDQFNNFQKPGDVAPEYTGNAAPEPLGQTANAPEPLGGIESLVAPSPKSYAPGMEPLGGMTPKPAPQNTGFNFDPSGGSLMSQLSSAYGGQTHNEQIGRGPAGFTQGFSDFFTGEGYYADPRGTFADGPWSISETPITLGSRMGGTLDPYGNMGFSTAKPTSDLQSLLNSAIDPSKARGAGGELLSGYNQRPNDLQQPIQQGVGLAGLYQQNNRGAGI